MTFEFVFFDNRKSSEEILEQHAKQLKAQLQERDQMIDKLRDTITTLESEKEAALHRVRVDRNISAVFCE